MVSHKQIKNSCKFQSGVQVHACPYGQELKAGNSVIQFYGFIISTNLIKHQVQV